MDVFIKVDESKYSSELTDEQKTFPDLTLLQKYDSVLDVLYSESGKAPTFDDINNVLLTNKKKVHWGETMDVLYSMIGEGYLSGHLANKKGEQIFLLSFNGKLLKERGGLIKKVSRENLTKKRVTFLEITTFILAIGTLYFAAGGVNDSTLKQTNELIEKSIPLPNNKTQSKQYFDRSMRNYQRSSRQAQYDSVAKRFFYLDTFYIGVDTVFVEK